MLGMPTPDVWLVYDQAGNVVTPPIGNMEQANLIAQSIGGKAQVVDPAWSALSKENGSYFLQLVKDWQALEDAEAKREPEPSVSY